LEWQLLFQVSPDQILNRTIVLQNPRVPHRSLKACCGRPAQPLAIFVIISERPHDSRFEFFRCLALMFARAALSLRVPRLAAASAPRLAAASAPRLGAAPVRSLLTTTAPRPSTVLAPRVCAPVRALRTSRTALAENPRSNVFVLDSYIVKEWSEIPKGGIHGTNKTNAIWSIWYNHAVTPLYATIALATAVMVWFLYRYFVKCAIRVPTGLKVACTPRWNALMGALLPFWQAH
jgi:hypothetical protein